MTSRHSAPQRTGTAASRRWLKLTVFVLAILAINAGGTWLTHQIDFQLFPRHEPLLRAAVLGTALLYVALMAIPFMPGIEVGLALMLLLGAKGALLVYLCTVLALSISFAVGRVVPPRVLLALLDWLHLDRAAALVRELEPLDPRQRLALLQRKAPARIAPFLLRHRYLTIAALLNVPGNALIGGGGGIGLVAGMSRIYAFPAYVALVALAVSPIPLALYFT